jgi:hypothetical protein
MLSRRLPLGYFGLMIGSPTLLALGLFLLLLGYLMLNWASKRNLKDAAIGAAFTAGWTLFWKRERPAVPEAVTSRANEVRAQDTHLGKAKVVSGYAVKHVIAQIVGIGGAITMFLGAVLVGLGVFWH